MESRSSSSRVRLLRQSICDESQKMNRITKGPQSPLSISYRLVEKREKKLNSSPQEWAPLSYPLNISWTNAPQHISDVRGRFQERYRKGNRMTIQTRRKATQIKPPSPALSCTNHCYPQATPEGGSKCSGTETNTRRRIGRISRYRIASMAARFRIAWLGPTRGRLNSQDVRGLSPKAEGGKESREDCSLCVSFECDSLSEELGEEREKRGNLDSVRGFFFIAD